MSNTKNETLLLNIISELLDTCELNTDDMETETKQTILKAFDYLEMFGRVEINGGVKRKKPTESDLRF